MSTLLTEKEIKKISIQTALDVSDLKNLSVSGNPIFIDDVVSLTGYSKGTLYIMVHKKQIPFHKVAGRRRLYFNKSEIISWMTGTKTTARVKGVQNA
jgi:excisionase family DNA binding protein